MDKLFFDYGRGQPWIAMDNENTHHKFLNFLTQKMQPLLTIRKMFQAYRNPWYHVSPEALSAGWNCRLKAGLLSRGTLLKFTATMWVCVILVKKNEGIIVAHFHTRPNIQSLASTSRDRQETSAEGSLFWQLSSQEKRRTWYASNRKQEAKGGDQVSFQSGQDHFILITLMIVALSRVLLVLNNQQKEKRHFAVCHANLFAIHRPTSPQQAQQLPLRRRLQHALPKQTQTTFAQLRRLPEGFLHQGGFCILFGPSHCKKKKHIGPHRALRLDV